ncbi:MAG: DUF1987 domain-containing protein [Bacteroidales bacterium]|nr:DUF1987 domain-containing protein [Bacteroidales bacterium]
METIKIQGTEDTPKVILDKDSELYEISGRSLPEDVASFYEPVINWLNEYAETPNAKTVFNFKLVYFNTASSKMLLDILMKLEEIHEEGKSDVMVRWHYPEDDEDMEEAGEEYADIVDVPFEQVGYTG